MSHLKLPISFSSQPHPLTTPTTHIPTPTPTPTTKEIKSELYQWGNESKILEKPKILRGRSFKQICCSGTHSLALLEDGTVYSWGQGRCGQLGHGPSVISLEQPQQIPFNELIERIWCGWTQSAFLTQSKRLYICGLVGVDSQATPEHLPSFDNVRIIDIAFGPCCIGKGAYAVYSSP